MKMCDIKENVVYAGYTQPSSSPTLRRVIKFKYCGSGDRDVIYDDLGRHDVPGTYIRGSHICSLKTFAKWAKYTSDECPTIQTSTRVSATLQSAPPLNVKVDGHTTSIKVTSIAPVGPRKVEWNDVNIGEAFVCANEIWLAVGLDYTLNAKGNASSLLNVRTLAIIDDAERIVDMHLVRCNIDIFVTVK